MYSSTGHTTEKNCLEIHSNNAKRASAAMINVNMGKHEQEVATTSKKVKTSEDMKLLLNGKSNSDRTKHIALRHFFVKQYLDDGTFHIVHCPTEDMIADILTKPLQGLQFFKLRALVLGHSVP